MGDFQKLSLGLYVPPYKGPTRTEYWLNYFDLRLFLLNCQSNNLHKTKENQNSSTSILS